MVMKQVKVTIAPWSNVAFVVESGFKAGAPGEIRTRGLRFRKPLFHCRARQKTAERRRSNADLVALRSSFDPFVGASCTLGKGLELMKATRIREVLGDEAFSKLLDALFSNRRDPERQVYFIGADDGGLIKIGYAKGVLARLAMLRRETGRNLSILALTEGGKRLEFAYHVKFEEHRAYGEWYWPHPEILAEISTLNQQVPA